MKFHIILKLLSAVAIASGQTLENTSFETQGPSPSEIHAWGTWGKGIFRVDKSEWAPVHEGDAMLGFRHWESDTQETVGIFQDVKDITAGTLYQYSVMVYLDSPESGTLPSQIELRFESEIDGAMATVSKRIFDPKEIERDKWIEINVVGTAPKDNLRVLLIITPSDDPGGAIKFDNVKIIKTIPSTLQP